MDTQRERERETVVISEDTCLCTTTYPLYSSMWINKTLPVLVHYVHDQVKECQREIVVKVFIHNITHTHEPLVLYITNFN